MRGQVKIEQMRPLPEPLNILMNGDNAQAKLPRQELSLTNGD